MELKDTHMALNKDSLTASYGLWNYYLIELNGTYKDSLIWNLQWFSYKNKNLKAYKAYKVSYGIKWNSKIYLWSHEIYSREILL